MSTEHRTFNLISRVFVMSALAVAVCIVFSGCGLVKKKGQQKRMATAATQIKLLDQALDSYKLDVGTYPSSLQGLVENIDQSEKWTGPYLKPSKIPMDPWGNEYQYCFPGIHNANENGFGGCDVWSYGADGQEGGTGENTDFTNWSY